MKDKNICILDRVAKNKKLYDGQTVLTRMISDELKRQMNDCKFYFIDTYNYKKNFIKCLFMSIFYLIKCNTIVMLLSRNGLAFYLPFLYYANKIFKRNIYHRVIGGNLENLIQQHPKWIKYLNALNYNYVELESLSNKLCSIGIENVKVSPNFKNINILDKDEIKKYNDNDEIRFCTFSRVVKKKGITDAINAILKYNAENEKKLYLDIYGPVDDSYENELHELLMKSKFISYKGIVSYTDTVNTLKKYYMLLFPTFWEGEGFPGTLIDAFSAGLPIIATNWNYNPEIIENGKTGILYDYQNTELLYEKIKYSIEKMNLINEMRFNCIVEAKKYNPQKVVSKIVNDINKGL